MSQLGTTSAFFGSEFVFLTLKRQLSVSLPKFSTYIEGKLPGTEDRVRTNEAVRRRN